MTNTHESTWPAGIPDIWSRTDEEQLQEMQEYLQQDAKALHDTACTDAAEKGRSVAAAHLLGKLVTFREQGPTRSEALKHFTDYCDNLVFAARNAESRPPRPIITANIILARYAGRIHSELEQWRVLNIPPTERVADGAVLLDKKFPKWFTQLDPNGPHLWILPGDTYRQLTGADYDKATERLQPQPDHMGYDITWRLRYGFATGPEEVSFRKPTAEEIAAVNSITALWQAEAAARRQ